MTGDERAERAQEAEETQGVEAESLIGLKLDHGRYEIVKLIGEGGMGRVFQARQVSMNRMVAVKVLRAQLAADEHLLARFQQEALSVSRLRHPNTITVFDYGRTDEGYLFIAMELLGGHSLADLLAEEKRLPLDRTLHIIEQVCSAVAEAHQFGIVHRDLKPENIQIDKVGNDPDFAKVLDFGIAKIIHGDHEESGAKTLTIAGTVFGTPHYMSPEQVHGLKVDHRTDVYALGCILYELLVGTPPFQGATPMAVMMAQASKPAPDILQTDADVTETVADIIQHCLVKNLEARMSSANGLLERIQEARIEIGDPTSSLSIRGRMTSDITPADDSSGRGRRISGRRPTITPEYSGQLAEVTEDDPALDALSQAPDDECGPQRGAGVKLIAAIALVAAVGGGAWFAMRPGEVPAPIPESEPDNPVRIQVKGATIKYRVRSAPSGATVRSDGEVIGKTPTTVTRPEGQTPLLTFELDGYATKQLQLPGTGARTQDIPVDLERLAPAKAWLKLVSDPPGADVYVDEELLGTTPFEWRPVAADGEVQLRFAKTGFAPQTVLAELAASSSATQIETELKRLSTPKRRRRPREVENPGPDKRPPAPKPAETKPAGGPSYKKL